MSPRPDLSLGIFVANSERRSIYRRRALKTGKIIFNDRQSVIDCVVRDESDAGARLKVGGVLGIPDEFS